MPCSTPCNPGYFCPNGTAVLSAALMCTSPTAYCPLGSATPQATASGFYAVVVASAAAIALYFNQSVCPQGSYCVAGVATLCPSGRFGNVFGSTDPLCSGGCTAGYYCPPGSTTATQLPCGGAAVYCPQAAPWRQPVAVGFFSTPENGDPSLRVDQSRCPSGSYCVSGARQLCDAGYYGDTEGQTSRTCTGPCQPGYYCDSGSNTSTQHECGSASVYCPEGSSIPRPALPGELTVGPSLTRRNSTLHCPVSQYCVQGTAYPCPAGRFGCATGLGTPASNGPCAAGSYCPTASSNNKMFSCGNASVYCPEGSPAPQPVDVGYYSYGGLAGYIASAQAPCPMGFYCIDGVKVSLAWCGRCTPLTRLCL